MDTLQIVILLASGLLSGIVNTLAGSGSLVTLPALIFAGLPPTIANGTNRVAILLQCVTGVWSFKRHNKLPLKHGLKLSIPAIAGALIGAAAAVKLNEELLRVIIGTIMALMLAVMLIKPKRWLPSDNLKVQQQLNWTQGIALFCIGLYGGFIQAGIGIFLLAGLVMSVGYDLVRANALKLLIVLVYTPFALGVFVYNDMINWEAALYLSLGGIAGAMIAARMAVSWGPKFVRWVLFGVVGLSALYMFGVVEWVWEMIGK